MEQENILLEIVAPDGVTFSGNSDMVTVPGTEGEFGVLPQHIGLVSSLDIGVVHSYINGNVNDSFFVTGGFVEVTEKKCVILSEYSINVKDIESKTIELKLRELNKEVSKVNLSDSKRQNLDKEILILTEQLKACGKFHEHVV